MVNVKYSLQYTTRPTADLLYRNFPSIILYGALEMVYVFSSVSSFARADGFVDTSSIFTQIAGGFGCLSSLAGFYLLWHQLREDIQQSNAPPVDNRVPVRRIEKIVSTDDIY